jgi:hypothetical protein
VSDPFAPSTDPDIPTPTRSDLLRLVHGENQDQLEAGSLSAKVAETLWADARRQWDEGHKAKVIQKADKPSGSVAEADNKAAPGAKPSPRARGYGSADGGKGRQSDSPDYGNLSDAQLRQQRIDRAYQSGQQPDPEDLAEEEAEAERYHRKLAEARERKRKEVEAEFSPKPIAPMQAVQQADKEQPSNTALAKFDKLAERNSFMGGGLSMAIAAYAFLLGGAPRFGFILLVLSWFVIAISVWRHRFFENRKHENTWNIIVCSLIGILLFVIWILLV